MCIHDCPVPIYQDESELVQLRTAVRAIHPQAILEIGSLFGGTLWYWMQDNPGCRIVSIDIGVGGYDYRRKDVDYAVNMLWPVWTKATGSQLIELRSDSTQAGTIKTAGIYAPFDFIFIDGGHKYQTVLSDFSNYWPMLREGGILAMHDIAYPDDNPQGFGVGKAWREVRGNGEWIEVIRDPNPEQIWGIGVMWKSVGVSEYGSVGVEECESI